MRPLCSLLLMLIALAGCGRDTRITVEHRLPQIYPDYTSIVIPYNIAPLNFTVQEEGERFKAVIRSEAGTPVTISNRTSVIRIPIRRWKKLLADNKEKTLYMDLYVKRHGTWTRFDAVENHISEDPIDPYLTYRLIEPGYVNYGEISLQERNLENFNTRILVSNQRDVVHGGDFCINCHTPRERNAAYTVFHVRGKLGGTVITTPEQAVKVNMKTDSTFSAAVYPAWHPVKNRIAFSINSTGQLFHTTDLQKVEVFDTRSDLVMYDTDRHTITPICQTDDRLETFPAWSPDGKYLYYCSAPCPPRDEAGNLSIPDVYQQFYYDLIRRPYDAEADTFGRAEIMVLASSAHLSVSFPRLSPDGRFLLFCLSEYGTFSIWHKSSDLYMIDLQENKLKRLEAVNSPETESYHAWSSNSRWIVVSSRRENGNYTRPYIAYIRPDGQETKAFLLPQRDPSRYPLLLKSFNVPEFMTGPAVHARRKYDDVIHLDAIQATYKPLSR